MHLGTENFGLLLDGCLRNVLHLQVELSRAFNLLILITVLNLGEAAAMCIANSIPKDSRSFQAQLSARNLAITLWTPWQREKIPRPRALQAFPHHLPLVCECTSQCNPRRLRAFEHDEAAVQGELRVDMKVKQIRPDNFLQPLQPSPSLLRQCSPTRTVNP